MKKKDQILLAEAYSKVLGENARRSSAGLDMDGLMADQERYEKNSEASKAFMGDPRDCHFANDLDGRVEKIRQQLLRGVKFRLAYMKWGHYGLVYRDTPYEDFEAALMPIED